MTSRAPSRRRRCPTEPGAAGARPRREPCFRLARHRHHPCCCLCPSWTPRDPACASTRRRAATREDRWSTESCPIQALAVQIGTFEIAACVSAIHDAKTARCPMPRWRDSQSFHAERSDVRSCKVNRLSARRASAATERPLQTVASSSSATSLGTFARSSNLPRNPPAASDRPADRAGWRRRRVDRSRGGQAVAKRWPSKEGERLADRFQAVYVARSDG